MVADAFSTFDNLIPRVDVIVNGSRTIKNVKPALMHISQLLTSIVQGERASSAAAAAALDNFPTADGSFVYGTTGQITTVREAVLISFENPFARIGKETTWLNLKGVASAEIRFTTAAYSSLLGFANTAPVVYTASTFAVDIYIIEQPDVDASVRFADFKETTKQLTFSAQTSSFAIDINRGNRVQGLMLLTRDGAAGSTTTATGKLANSLVVTNMQLIVNGSRIIKATDFKALQAENRIRFGINAPYASNVSRLDGVAYLDLLSDDARGDLNTALDARGGQGIDNLQLVIDTNTSANVSYTNPVSVEIMTQEIVSPQ